MMEVEAVAMCTQSMGNTDFVCYCEFNCQLYNYLGFRFCPWHAKGGEEGQMRGNLDKKGLGEAYCWQLS